ncbi:MAG: hypothetical protein NTX53_19925 [candidate division WOR-3 bacterium]|nr:hypothetical protein [candidate division WOR-3 bacterium]
MNLTRYCLPLVLLAFLAGCTSLLTESVVFTGTARLSDNPAGGYAGTQVSAGEAVAFTDSAGAYRLEGQVLFNRYVDVSFSKDGYESLVIRRYLSAASNERVIELGDTVLQKSPGE